MISLNSYDSLGKSGLDMMQSSLNAANAAGAKIAESGADPMSIAAASMVLVKSQNELMETSLQIFGIGTKHSGLY